MEVSAHRVRQSLLWCCVWQSNQIYLQGLRLGQRTLSEGAPGSGDAVRQEGRTCLSFPSCLTASPEPDAPSLRPPETETFADCCLAALPSCCCCWCCCLGLCCCCLGLGCCCCSCGLCCRCCCCTCCNAVPAGVGEVGKALRAAAYPVGRPHPGPDAA